MTHGAYRVYINYATKTSSGLDAGRSATQIFDTIYSAVSFLQDRCAKSVTDTQGKQYVGAPVPDEDGGLTVFNYTLAGFTAGELWVIKELVEETYEEVSA